VNQEAISVLFVSNGKSFVDDALKVFKKIAHASSVFHTCSLEDAYELSHHESLSAVLIDLEAGDESYIPKVERVAKNFAGAKIVCSGPDLSVSLILKLVKSNVRDFLRYPFQDGEVVSLIFELENNPVSNGQRKAGQVITLFGPKGGVGVTLLAANLGVTLAQRGVQKVAICDLHPQCGDIATYLNMTPKHTLRDLVDQYDLLDASFLDGVMLKHDSGVKILAGPQEGQQPLRSDSLRQVQSVISLLRQNNDVVLIDAGHSETGILNSVLELSDLIFLIGNLDVPSLKGLVSCFNQMVGLRFDAEKIKVIINRYDAKNRIDINEFQKKTKHPVACRLPINYALCIDAVNTGRPISEIQKNSSFARKLGELSLMIQGNGTATSTKHVADKPDGSLQRLAMKSSSLLRGWL